MRQDPPSSGPELLQLTGFLDFLRETVLLKTERLTREQLAQRLPPSSMTLAGLLYHLTNVEDWWFRVRFLGLPETEPWGSVDWEADPGWDFRVALELEPLQLRRGYREAVARSAAVVEQVGDLNQLSVPAKPNGQCWDLRWVLLHMIEETARHAGHADLLREAADGAVGE